MILYHLSFYLIKYFNFFLFCILFARYKKHAVQGGFHREKLSQRPKCLMMNIMMLLQRAYSRLNTFKFIAVIYILNQIIPILNTVSKIFQKGPITFSHRAPNLAYVKMKLQEEALSHKAITDCVKDLKPNERPLSKGLKYK